MTYSSVLIQVFVRFLFLIRNRVCPCRLSVPSVHAPLLTGTVDAVSVESISGEALAAFPSLGEGAEMLTTAVVSEAGIWRDAGPAVGPQTVSILERSAAG